MTKTMWNTDENGNEIDYSKYRCPYDYVEKECGHELNFTFKSEDTGLARVWCSCGYRSPVCYTDPIILKLELK